ncbi:ProQ/FINO family protein [Robbsia sp. KACC 23696]|uniref:ProQ/FINO family protein n=1 Tax=Robbsia sp. KACC 23696 TaxID=3149231 RepID=UPI00325ABCEF
MGFEELAALKQQLSKQSQGKRETNDGASGAARATQSERKALAAAAANSAEQSRTTERRGQGGARPAQPGGQKRVQTPGQARPASGRGPRPDAARGEGASRPADGARRPPRRNGNPSQQRDAKPADGTTGAVSAEATQHAPRAGAGKRPPRERQPGVGHPTRPTRPERQVDPVVLTIGQLQKHFPLAFPKNPEPKKPLKLGISKDLAAQAETLALAEPAILEAIKVWCQGSRYWAAMSNGAARVDLNGEPDGIVTPEQAGHARYLAAAARRAKRQDKQPDGATADATAKAAAEPVPPTDDPASDASAQTPQTVDAPRTDATDATTAAAVLAVKDSPEASQTAAPSAVDTPTADAAEPAAAAEPSPPAPTTPSTH